MTRGPDRRAGWERIEFRCWHSNRGVLSGPPAFVDVWEREARSNPCKLIDCPQRVRPREG